MKCHICGDPATETLPSQTPAIISKNIHVDVCTECFEAASFDEDDIPAPASGVFLIDPDLYDRTDEDEDTALEVDDNLTPEEADAYEAAYD